MAIASRRVMEKLGFLHEADREIKGELCAVYRLQRALNKNSVSSRDLFPGPIGPTAWR
jgi:hypothetical protein